MPGGGASKGRTGEIWSAHTLAFREIWGRDRPPLTPSPVRGDYNHSALTFGDRFFLKLFRKVEPDRSPEMEVEQLLNQKSAFRQAPRVAGWLEYHLPGQEPVTHRHPAGPRAVRSQRLAIHYG